MQWEAFVDSRKCWQWNDLIWFMFKPYHWVLCGGGIVTERVEAGRPPSRYSVVQWQDVDVLGKDGDVEKLSNRGGWWWENNESDVLTITRKRNERQPLGFWIGQFGELVPLSEMEKTGEEHIREQVKCSVGTMKSDILPDTIQMKMHRWQLGI